MSSLREIWTDLLVIGFGIFFTWVFVYIKLNGVMTIMEENSLFLWLELIISPLLIVLGLERLWHDIKRNRKEK